MKKLFTMLLAIMLTSCTGLSMFQTAAVNLALDRVYIPERQVNESLTGDEQLEEEEELFE